MHKGIIFLIKTDSKAEAINTTEEFLEGYKNNVWDWYSIGGRWTGNLSLFYPDFIKKSKMILTTSQNEVNKKQPELQNLWESIGAKGPNPYANHYNLPDRGGEYDILPLSDCISKVKEWQQTIEDAKKKEAEAKEWLAEGGRKDEEGTPYDNYQMYGYCLGIAANLFQQEFCFDCNIFNLETCNYSIPEDIENYYAVMIDIHN